MLNVTNDIVFLLQIFGVVEKILIHMNRETRLQAKAPHLFPSEFPFLSSNIPRSPAYGVFVSQLARYSRSSSDYQDFVKRSSILVARLTKHGFSLSRLHHAVKKFYGCHQDLIGKYDKSMSAIAKAILSV